MNMFCCLEKREKLKEREIFSRREKEQAAAIVVVVVSDDGKNAYIKVVMEIWRERGTKQNYSF